MISLVARMQIATFATKIQSIEFMPTTADPAVMPVSAVVANTVYNQTKAAFKTLADSMDCSAFEHLFVRNLNCGRVAIRICSVSAVIPRPTMSAIVLPDFANGHTEVGIAAGSDDVDEPYAILRIGEMPTTESAAKAMYDVCVAIAASYGDPNNAKQADKDVILNALGFATDAEVVTFLQSGSAAQASAVKNKYSVHATGVNLLATVALNPCPYSERIHCQIWNSVIGVAVGAGWRPLMSKYHKAVNMEETIIGLIRPPSRSDVSLRAGFYDKAKAMTLVAATKVTWFLTNHHVGQNCGKVVGAMGLRPDDRDLRKVLWIGGKWTSTKSVLKGLKIGNISDTVNDMSVGTIDISASDDMNLRRSAAPAGTAACTTYHYLSQFGEM
jgi:hypothetical protein